MYIDRQPEGTFKAAYLQEKRSVGRKSAFLWIDLNGDNASCLHGHRWKIRCRIDYTRGAHYYDTITSSHLCFIKAK